MSFTVVVIFDELDLMLFAVARGLDFQRGEELVRLGQFVGGFEVILTAHESEFLLHFAAANSLQLDVAGAQRRGGMPVLIEEVEPEAGRHTRLKHAQLHSS